MCIYIYIFFLIFVYTYINIVIPQQRKLMGSSAQNSSGVYWCRRVRFNEVPEKVPEKSGRLWCKARSGSTGFRKPWCKAKSGSTEVPEKVPEKVPEEVGEALVQSQVRFNKVPEKVPEEGWMALVQRQVRFWRRFR